MDAALARYCDAHNECRGPSGSNGDDGDVGAPGRGIQSLQCATGGFIVTYTDGIAAPAGGPCRGPQGERGEKGEPGKDSTVPGPQGTATPGTYTCPDSEYVGGFTVAEGGAVTIDPPNPETPTPGD
jgi:hypothetical protein